MTLSRTMNTVTQASMGRVIYNTKITDPIGHAFANCPCLHCSTLSNEVLLYIGQEEA